MTTPPTDRTTRKKKPILPRRRASLGSASRDWVEITPFSEEHRYPTLVTPVVEGLDLNEWAADNTAFIEELYHEKRAILFRGFAPPGVEGFGKFVDLASGGPRLPYRDRSTPRDSYGDNIYCTTIYPAEQTIRLHNEGSYWIAWAMKAFFGCITAPDKGGETPIADVHGVHERIDPKVREEFARKKWMLVRNYNDGFALPWQEVFQTSERSEVEDYCRSNRIDFEWKDGDRLTTRQIRPAIRKHPRTGEALWFNHAAFFHITSREDAIRDSLLAEFGEDELPYHTRYGDGSPIDPEVVRHINAAYDAELIMFRWQEGDVHLIDNMRLAHARQPYEGERLILVALTEGYAGPEE